MFDQTPVQERHAAIGVFAAIALSAFGAFYLLLTGGFAPIMPASAEAAPAPTPAYVRVIQSDWAPPAEGRVTPTAYVMGEDYASDYPIGQLDGGDAAAVGQNAERSYQDISRDIEALYEQTSEHRQEDYGNAVYDGETPSADGFVYSSADEPKDAAISDDGNASPW